MDAVTKLFAGYTIGDESYRQVDRFCSPYGKRVLLIGGETGMSKGLPVLCAVSYTHLTLPTILLV